MAKAKRRRVSKNRKSRVSKGQKSTKDRLKEAFWELLEEKAYNKVTVRDIVERCGVNRNTFYYHFQDIPSLLEETVGDWVSGITDNQHIVRGPIDLIIPVALEFGRHQKAILNIYNSIYRDSFRNSFDRMAGHFAEVYVDITSLAQGKTDQEHELLVRLTKCVISGIMEDWVANGMDYDLMQTAMQVYGMFYDAGLIK